MTRVLRSYQTQAVKEVRAAWGRGMMRPAIVLPTGTGKTDVIAKVATDAAHDGKRVLALAHRGELLDQIAERCGMHAPGIPVGRVQAARNETRRPITVAMMQTLGNEARRNRMPKPHVVIVDEAHHAASPSYMEILAWAGCFDHTPLMGVTATMVRGDKRGLGDVWQDIVFQRDIRWAIGQGYLVPPRGKAVVVDHMDLTKAKTSRGDYQDGELGEMVAQDVDQIVQAWMKHARDRLTVAFTPSVDSAQQLADEFRANGIAVGEVYGNTSKAERERAYRQLATGRIRVLVGVMVTTEGWDCPPVDCILQCRPTKLPGLYTQIVGRGLRPSPGKLDCLVLDVVGASRGQRLITLAELHPTAAYDNDEVDRLPCDDCGSLPCVCPPALRDADGGRRRLDGPAEYEDIDFFSQSKLNWLFTHGGKRFLSCGDRVAVLWPKGDLYRPGHRTTRGTDSNGKYIGVDGKWLSEPCELEEARLLAESWALDYDPSLSSRTSSWRKGKQPASEKQIRTATNLGIEDPHTMTKARVSDEISIVLASVVLDK